MDGAISIIVERFADNRPAETASFRQAAIVGKEEPLTFVLYNGGVDAAPPVLRVETILTGKQRLSYSILIRPGYLIAHSYADTAAVGGYVEIVFAVALCHMSGVCLFAGGPLEVEYA